MAVAERVTLELDSAVQIAAGDIAQLGAYDGPRWKVVEAGDLRKPLKRGQLRYRQRIIIEDGHTPGALGRVIPISWDAIPDELRHRLSGSPLTWDEEQAFRAEYEVLRIEAANQYGTAPLQCAACGHRWISYPKSRCPLRERSGHPTSSASWR